MSQPPPSLTLLAERISKSTETIESFLKDKQLPAPSFDADGPKTFPATDENPDILAARDELIDCTQELRDLVVGPTDTIKWRTMTDHTFTVSLQAIYRFKIAQAVPLTGDISIADLAKATSLSEVDVARIVRCAAVYHIFQEKDAGRISHTATSALLAQDEGLRALLGHMTDGAFPAAAKMCDFLEQFPGSQEPDQSPYTMMFGVPMFGRGAKEPYIMKRFIDAMTAWSTGDGSEGIVQGYDWKSVGSGKVVDVGGAAGHISLAVASYFPDLTFIVQDRGSTAVQAETLMKTYPESVRSRVQWQAHNFFEPQPAECRGASVYLLRYICHDWSDLYASKILAAVADAMGPDSRLLIADAVLPPREAKIPRAQEAILRGFDISMLCQLNARERAIEDWAKLLKMANDKFEVVSVKPPAKAGEVSIIEAKLV